MKKINIFQRLCLILGMLMLISGLTIFVWWEWNIRSSQERGESYVQTLCSLMPETQNSFPELRRDNSMAVLALDGLDFVGIVEMPLFGSVLPVCADWGQVYKYPCRFDGSIYDGSLKIGVSSQKGQYDFYRDVSVGDAVYFTDMEGHRFSCTVSDIRYEKHADLEALSRVEADLTLFIKNVYAFEYIIVFCNAAG